MSATTTPRERPILFKPEMVRAILSGSKTQTRRIITPQDTTTEPGWMFYRRGKTVYGWEEGKDNEFAAILWAGPYGSKGTRLWVRETWAPHEGRQHAYYYADHPDWRTSADGEDVDINRWRPSIHMPRWACRLVLEVTEVRVERLQDISDEDVRAEGIRIERHPEESPEDYAMSHVEAYAEAWDRINGARASWDSNPWVWVVSFKPVSP